MGKVFVLGSPRSGTSIVGRSITRVVGGQMYSESHLIPLFYELNLTLEGYFSKFNFHQSMMASTFDSDFFRGKLDQLIKDVTHGVVVDKTPGVGMINSVPLIKRLWPDAKIIFCYRRGIENVISRLKKWPNVSFENHCRDWAAAMDRWKYVSSNVDCIEIEQLDVALKPHVVAEELAEYLGMAEAQLSVLKRELSQSSSEGIPSLKPKAISDVGWGEEQVLLFKELCGAAMAQYGYLYSGEYRKGNF